MAAKKEEFALLEGERIIFSSKRGGMAGYASWQYLIIIFGGMWLFGAVMAVPLILANITSADLGGIFSALVGIAAIGLCVHWFLTWRKPAFFLTTKRLVARRFLLPPISLELENIAVARRRVVQYTRYGALVREDVTHRVALGFHTGGARLIGPIDRVEEFMEVLSGYLQGAVHPRALPGENGEPAEAETRQDLFFAAGTLTGGVRRGPLFVGPTKIIAFASELPRMRLYQMLSLARKDLPPSDVEASMLNLANHSEWGRGASVVMEREGLTLWADEATFRVGSGEKSVEFELFPRDGKRLARYVSDQGAHPYRG